MEFLASSSLFPLPSLLLHWIIIMSRYICRYLMCYIALSNLVISKLLWLQLALYLECFQNNGLWCYFGLLGIEVLCPLHGMLTHRKIFPDIILIEPLANGALNPALAAWRDSFSSSRRMRFHLWRWRRNQRQQPGSWQRLHSPAGAAITSRA